MTGSVVVGLDGSPAGMTAAWWAAREALARRLPLLLVHSWTSRPLDVHVARAAGSKQRHGWDTLRRAEAELLQWHGDLTVSTELTPAPATQALLDHSESASMLVLGCRSLRPSAGRLVGPVGLHVVGLARCPTVTVRADDPAAEAGREHTPAADGSEIVVAVKEPGPAADALLEFAFTAAEPREAPLRAVCARPRAAGPVRPRRTDARPSPGGEGAAPETALTAVLAPWRAKFPAVTVVEHVAAGPAAEVLLAAAAHGRLAVVGRRMHRSRLAWRLGPVTDGALHRLPCPVAVVPHD